MSSARIKLCVTGEVPPGEARKVETHDLALAVFNVDGSFHVTDDACTHGPGSLSEGYLERRFPPGASEEEYELSTAVSD